MPPLRLTQTLSLWYPPNPTYTVSGSAGSTVMQVQYRCGLSPAGPGAPIRCHVGVADVPFVVRKTMPLRWPTQIVSGSPRTTAIALISDPALGLIEVQRGPEVGVFGVFASSVRHSCSPPASSRSALLGSSRNGAMNSADRDRASGSWNGTGFQSQSPMAWF